MSDSYNLPKKTQAMFNAMEPEVQARLERCIAILDDKAKTKPAIAKIFAPPKPVDYSDIPIDMNWSFEEFEENFRIFDELSDSEE